MDKSLVGTTEVFEMWLEESCFSVSGLGFYCSEVV